MATFKYSITKTQGGTDTGTIQASSKDEAAKMLNDQGLMVISIDLVPEKEGVKLFSRSRVKLVEKVVFFNNFSQMMKAGLSVTETLDALKDDTDNKYFRKIIEDLKYSIETGKTLSSGMERYPKVFSKLYTKIIEVGEIGGTLEDSTKQIATQVQRDYELRSKVKGALIYPEILFGVMLIAGGGLLIFIIPELSTFFQQAGLTLPITTRILIGLSYYLRNYAIEVVIGIIALYFIQKRLRRNPKVQAQYDRMILKLPIIGPVTKKVNMSIFARTLATLLKSGVPIGKALEIVSESAPNSIYGQSVVKFKDRVEKGEPLSVVMHDSPKLFTNLATRMVAVGDKTGTTPDMLFNVADFYQNQVNETLGNISTVIEPVMLFIMGGATLFIALSVITPIYQLTSGISSSS